MNYKNPQRTIGTLLSRLPATHILLSVIALAYISGCADRSSQEPGRNDTSVATESGSATRKSGAAADTGTARNSDSTAQSKSAHRSRLMPPTRTNPSGKYGIASARVVYFNSRSNGYDTLFFDGFGAREAYYTALDTRSEKPRLWVALYANGQFVQYDAITKGGDRIDRDQPTGPILGFIPDVWHPTPEKARIYNAASIEPREFLGRNGDGFEFTFDALYRLYLWEGIPLYQILTDLNDPSAPPRILEAKEISPKVSIPDSRFTVPKSVVLTEKGMQGR